MLSAVIWRISRIITHLMDWFHALIRLIYVLTSTHRYGRSVFSLELIQIMGQIRHQRLVFLSVTILLAWYLWLYHLFQLFYRSTGQSSNSFPALLSCLFVDFISLQAWHRLISRLIFFVSHANSFNLSHITGLLIVCLFNFMHDNMRVSLDFTCYSIDFMCCYVIFLCKHACYPVNLMYPCVISSHSCVASCVNSYY